MEVATDLAVRAAWIITKRILAVLFAHMTDLEEHL